MVFETYVYTIPTWAICVIEYGDYSGLNDHDIKALESFLNTLPINGHFSWPDDIDSEKYFSYRNDITSLGDEVIKVNYLIGS